MVPPRNHVNRAETFTFASAGTSMGNRVLNTSRGGNPTVTVPRVITVTLVRGPVTAPSARPMERDRTGPSRSTERYEEVSRPRAMAAATAAARESTPSLAKMLFR